MLRAPGRTLCLLALLACPADARDVVRDVRAVLRGHWSGDERSREEVVASLIGLGEGAIPTLFALYTGEQDLLRPTGSSEELPPERQTWWCDPGKFGALYLEALGQLPPDAVLDHVGGVLRREPVLEVELCAVRVLGRLGTVEALPALLELGEAFGPLALRYRSVRTPLEGAFANLLDVDPAVAGELVDALDDRSPELSEVLVAAARASESPESAELLGALIGKHAHLDRVAIEALAEKVEARPWQFDDEVYSLVRPSMFSDDWRLRAAACVALARAGDLDSFSTFTMLLSDEHAAVSVAASWALRRLSGLDSERAADEWLAWYDEREETWFGRRTARREDLWSSEPRRVMAALRELAEERLFRDEAAQELAELLDEDHGDLRLAACRALGQLGSKRVVPDLVELLDSRDAAASAAALEALAHLTGRPASDEADAFRSLVDA